jgi:hypothetical protein
MEFAEKSTSFTASDQACGIVKKKPEFYQLNEIQRSHNSYNNYRRYPAFKSHVSTSTKYSKSVSFWDQKPNHNYCENSAMDAQNSSNYRGCDPIPKTSKNLYGGDGNQNYLTLEQENDSFNKVSAHGYQIGASDVQKNRVSNNQQLSTPTKTLKHPPGFYQLLMAPKPCRKAVSRIDRNRVLVKPLDFDQVDFDNLDLKKIALNQA